MNTAMSRPPSLLDAWGDLQELSDLCSEVPIDTVLRLCRSDMLVFPSDSGGFGHVAFVEERGVGFCVLVCLVTGREYVRNGEGPVTDVCPTFLFRGRTFEGLIELRAAPHLPNAPLQMAEQMCWAQNTIVKRGWDDV